MGKAGWREGAEQGTRPERCVAKKGGFMPRRFRDDDITKQVRVDSWVADIRYEQQRADERERREWEARNAELSKKVVIAPILTPPEAARSRPRRLLRRLIDKLRS